MIVVTGGAGFIGSALVWELNNRGEEDILIVDELGTDEKWKNLVNLKYRDYLEKEVFIDQILHDEYKGIKAIIHMGACSSTTEQDASYLIENNFEYTKILAQYAVKKGIRFIYASSAATYGDGSKGYSDESSLEIYKPLNMYGYSKHMFDLWADKHGISDKIVGIKFFNVYGPNEYHKGDMRSMIHKAYGQIKETGSMKLFKSYKDKYKDGEQMRDFVYIKDAVNMTLYFLNDKKANGLFNVGTGKARPWNDLAKAVFKAMDKKEKISYIEMPDVLKNKYQYFTEADMSKFKNILDEPIKIFSLEDGIKDYIQNYIMKEEYL